MRNLMKAFVRDDRGVSAMEYAILAGISVVSGKSITGSGSDRR